MMLKAMFLKVNLLKQKERELEEIHVLEKELPADKKLQLN